MLGLSVGLFLTVVELLAVSPLMRCWMGVLAGQMLSLCWMGVFGRADAQPVLDGCVGRAGAQPVLDGCVGRAGAQPGSCTCLLLLPVPVSVDGSQMLRSVPGAKPGKVTGMLAVSSNKVYAGELLRAQVSTLKTSLRAGRA